MGDYDYGRENGLWGNDGIPYCLNDREPSYNDEVYDSYEDNSEQSEVGQYVNLMKERGISTIVAMNSYITKEQLWEMFSSIERENTYASGFTSVGISKDAYKEIMSLYKTNDIVKSHLVSQKRV